MLACALSGCTEPRYGEADGDAGDARPDEREPAPSDGGSDAQPLLDPQAWWAPLRNDYAVRVRFYGHDRQTGAGVLLKHEQLMLGKVSVAADGSVDLETLRCRDNGYIEGGILVNDRSDWTSAQLLPPVKLKLISEAGLIRTEGAARSLGYVPDQPAGCTDNAFVPHGPEQVWLGTDPCVCATDPLPVLPNDCRVTDPDRDQQPGITVTHSTLGDEFVRAKDDCQIRDGVLAADGSMHASFAENYDYLGLSCGAVCVHNSIVVCPLALNPVLFAPLPALSPSGAAWNCDSMLKQVDAGKFFPSEMLSFPVDCTL